jgi:hypothetical protein
MITNKKEFPPLPSQRKHKRRAKPSLAPPAKKSAIAKLDDLPDELLLEILECLPCPDWEGDNLKTIASLSLTNRRLHYMVEGKLYLVYNGFFHNPYLFLRACASNSRIAEKVKALTFEYNTAIDGTGPENYCPSLPDRRDIKAALKRMNIPDWKAWATKCNDEETNREILFATILMHTPKVAALDIQDGKLPYGNPKWLDLIRYAANGRVFGHMHLFQHLNSIKVDVGWLDLRQMMPLFRLPSLRALTINDLAEDEGTHPEVTLANASISAGSSLIEKLSLSAYIRSSSIAVCLEACRALRIFGYGHVSYVNSKIDCLRYPVIYAGLQRHQKSLERLMLNEYFDENRPAISQTGTMGDLRDFTNLSYLEVPLVILTKVYAGSCTALPQTLPPSLKSFTPSIGEGDYEKHCVFALKHMAYSCRTDVPLLEELTLVVQGILDSEDLYDWKGLQKIFRVSAGLCLQLQLPEDLENDSEFWKNVMGSSVDESETTTESDTDDSDDSGDSDAPDE